MEFTAYVDEPIGSDSLSLHRQRILAAQIKDSELGDEDLLLPSADTFDNSVENSVFANESALMEMDEVITQIQQWRNRATISNQAEEAVPEEALRPSAYHSEAYDRIFCRETHPESEGNVVEYTPRSPKGKKYVPDEEMIAKLQSLQALIKESKSTASVAAHQKHVSEYQALMAVLQERFGDKLASLRQEPTDSDDSSDEEGERRSCANRNESFGGEGARKSRKLRNNNDEEEDHAGAEKGGVVTRVANAHSESNLERQFKTIDLEVREGNYEVNRRKENEVIREGADLQSEVITLEDSLRDFTNDLDRLLMG